MKTIGIDLGTTNSCVYYLDDDGQPVLVTDRSGRYKFFPSAVWSAGPGRETIVGHSAKSRMGGQPPPIIAIKRKMGTTEAVALGGREVDAIEVSALILAHARGLVEAATADQVGAAVVTIPAYFDAAAKKATHEAAVKAFFDGSREAAEGRLELQLEPEAAAFAYTLEDAAERLRLLVFDLGGGTFDVTILDKSPEGGLTELKHGGDPHLGGENIDDRIARWLLYLLRGGRREALERIFAPDRYPEAVRYALLIDLLADDAAALDPVLRPEDRDLQLAGKPLYRLELDNRRAEDAARIQLLKRLAEVAKMDLSTSTETNVVRQGAFEDQEGQMVDIDLTLSRSELHLLVGDLMARTVEEARRALDEAGIEVAEIDRVLLVGGSTRMPIVAEELGKLFSCPIRMKDPDLIVARGAALKARSLGVVLTDARGRTLRLHYPRETSRRTVRIRGQLDEPLAGYRAFLMREGREVAQAAVVEDRFLLEEVPLDPEKDNRFELEIAKDEDEIYTEAGLAIRQSAGAVAVGGDLTTKLTKSIRASGTRGERTLFKEGLALPVEAKFVCYRSSQDDFIRISFFEGGHPLNDLVISNLSPELPLNAAIDLVLRIEKDYTARATATVRSTGQFGECRFEIEYFQLPSEKEMAEALADLVSQIDNDLELVANRNDRARFAQQARKLRRDFTAAKKELGEDRYHLHSILGELKKVLAEVRSAQQNLQPPFEVFERLLTLCRRLASELKPDSPMPQADVVEKIEALARAGKEAWDKDDAVNWRAITADLEKLHENLERALAGPSKVEDIPPAALQAALLRWLKELRDKVAENELGEELDARLEAVEAAARGIDLRDPRAARAAVAELVDNQVRALDGEIRRLKAKTGSDPRDAGGVWWQ